MNINTHSSVYYNITLLLLAAMFSIPASETVAEEDTPFDACVTLISGNASLATELVVSLTTADGTGKIKH